MCIPLSGKGQIIQSPARYYYYILTICCAIVPRQAGYGPARRQALQQEIARYRQQPNGNAQVQRLLDPYRRRMDDISVSKEKTLKRIGASETQRLTLADSSDSR
jgi:hypothetical protein